MVDSAEVEVRPLSRGQAERVTERIKAGLGSVLDDLRTALEGRAWEAMGYPSWNAYLTAEFEGQSRGNIWRIGTQVEVVKALTEAAGEPVEVSVREALAVKRVAKARVRQVRPGDEVRDEDIVDASRARDQNGAEVAMIEGRRMPVWLEPLGDDLERAAQAAGVSLREFVVAALLAAVEGVTAAEVVKRGKVGDLDGESERAIAEKVGLAKSSVGAYKRKAQEAARCESCGAIRGTHQNWCPRKGT